MRSFKICNSPNFDNFSWRGGGVVQVPSLACQFLNNFWRSQILVSFTFKHNKTLTLDTFSLKVNIFDSFVSLTDRFEEETTNFWLNLFDGCTFPFGPINNLEQVFDDPQVKFQIFCY